MPKLFVAATPIGNLEDVSDRFLKTLQEVDLIFAEDTRVTGKIVSHFDIKTSIKRYNEHNPKKSFRTIEELFSNGKDVALVSDSGTPGISDPGFKLVQYVWNNLPNVDIRVIPGASAVISALSVSGVPSNEFTFLGFPPAKNKRNKFFKNINNVDIRPVVLYESPHRLQKTFDDIDEFVDNSGIFVAKEMTKVHEDYFRGPVSKAKEYFKEKKGKGEFVIIIP